MIVKNKSLLAFCLFIGSCGLKAQDIKTCEDNYNKNELKECYTCTKNYLESNPTDTNAMALIVECAESQQELEFLDKFMRLQYENYINIFNENITFWIAYGDLFMKSGDSMRANERYLVANRIISSKVPTSMVIMGLNDTLTTHPNYYQRALTKLDYYKNNEKKGRYISKKRKLVALDEIINYLNLELINNSNDSATLALIKEVQTIIDNLK